MTGVGVSGRTVSRVEGARMSLSRGGVIEVVGCSGILDVVCYIY
jgi:hypothetical protein